MDRFTKLAITHTDGDGVDREYTLILDDNSHQLIDPESDFGGPFEQSIAFLRCRGHANEIYYQPWFFFDGLWNRLIRYYVTDTSGKGNLFVALEKFSTESALEPVS